MDVRSRSDALAVALDVPPAQARQLGAQLAPHVGYLKVGLSLFCSEGPAIVRELASAGAGIFLDLKLHDIPNTVELASQAVGRLGAKLLTVHASGGAAMVAAAVRGVEAGACEAGLAAPRILAVTVLTSLSAGDLNDLGLSGAPLEAVVRLARLAVGAGAGGLVCSPQEARAVRDAVGAGPLIVTPGVRPAGSAAGDQARAETPQRAMEAGADILVVGRAITQAADPVEAAKLIAEEMAG